MKNGKRQQIIDAAIDLFTQKGIDRTSLTDIAKAAGMSKGNLYYYYSSKNDLIFDIAEEHINRITNNLFEIIDDQSGQKNLDDLLKILYERILSAETRGILHVYLIAQAINGNEELINRFRKKYEQWNELIREGFRRLEPEDKKHTILSSLVIAALDGFLIQKLIGLDAISADEFVNHLDVKIKIENSSR